jgi:hypothetical protein
MKMGNMPSPQRCDLEIRRARRWSPALSFNGGRW